MTALNLLELKNIIRIMNNLHKNFIYKAQKHDTQKMRENKEYTKLKQK